MPVTHEYLVPDYYDHFVCKGGACRSTCCHGWPVTLSLREYYALLGLELELSLRRALDDSLRLVDENRSEQRFASLAHDYNGNCRLQGEDGVWSHCSYVRTLS